MKRSDFLKNIAALAVAIGIAPKIKAETWPKGSVAQDEIGLVRQYPYTPKDCLLIPDRGVMGKDGRHVLIFDYPPTPDLSLGDVLLDEKRRIYAVVAIDKMNYPETRVHIVDAQSGQHLRGRSRRRGIIPTIGKQYAVFANQQHES